MTNMAGGIWLSCRLQKLGISVPIITAVDTDFTIILHFGLFCLKTCKICC